MEAVFDPSRHRRIASALRLVLGPGPTYLDPESLDSAIEVAIARRRSYIPWQGGRYRQVQPGHLELVRELRS